MRKFHVLVHSLLLVTSPSLFAYPHCELPIIQQICNQEKSFDDINLTYDQIIKLLQDIEEERIEGLSEEKIDRITHFIAFLAQQGMLPGDYAVNVSLENDIAALFGIKSDFFDYARDYDYAYASNFSYEPVVVSTLLNSEDAVTSFCKSKHQKKEEEKQKKQLKKEKERQKQAKKDAKKQKNHGNKNDHHHKHKNAFTKVKDFIVKHKKAIIIGAAVVVGVTVIIVAIAAASSAAVAAAGAAAGASAAPNPTRKSDTNENQENTSSTSPPADPPHGMMATHDLSALKSAIDHQIVSFKENLMQNQFFQPTNPSIGQQGLSWEENGRALGSLFAHDSYQNIQHQLSSYRTFSQEIQDINSYTYPIFGWNQSALIGHSEIDQKFSTDYSYLYSNPSQQVDFNTLSYQVRGERALSSGYYNQAVQDLGKAIEANPANPIAYLERGMAHFSLDQYENSLEDYQQFASHTQVQSNSLSVSEFSLGFAKGLPKGVYESGEGLLLFMADFVTHPIETSRQMVDSVSTLVDLVRQDEWGVVAEALSPEVHQLVTQWDSLSSDKKGELAGYALGKYGTDFLAPGALAKVASKSVKSAQELVAVCKNLQIAQETLILETAAGVGNSAKIAEVVHAGQTMMALGEDVGLTAHEMAQLKQVGKLESTINGRLDRLVSQSESEVFKAAINKDSHVKMARDYLDRPAKEIQKGIRSYEKQIALHQEKISNPSKFIPHWDKLHPERQHALINKKWPAEIQCYTEQRDLLQSILNERLN